MVFGGVVEAVGLAITGWGIRETWLASGTSEGFTGPLVTRGWHAVHQVKGGARRLLRMPAVDATVSVTSARTASWVNIPSVGVVGHEPLDRGLPTAEALATLDERLRGLAWIMQENRKADLEQLTDVYKRGLQTATDVTRVRADLNAAEMELAVGGLRTEALGLGLVGMGLLIQLLEGWALLAAPALIVTAGLVARWRHHSAARHAEQIT